MKRALEARDVEAMCAPERWGAGLLASAHPTLEHYAPVLYALGSTDENDSVTFPHEGIEFGSISMRLALFQSSAPA